MMELNNEDIKTLIATHDYNQPDVIQFFPEILLVCEWAYSVAK